MAMGAPKKYTVKMITNIYIYINVSYKLYYKARYTIL